MVLAALGASGAVSMVYEVAWTRALALVIGSSTYAFTAMLVVFLIGIAGGSAIYSWLWGTRRPTAATFAGLQLGIGGVGILTLLGFERMPELFLIALRWSDSPSFVEFTQLLVSSGALLPCTLLIGATFPCAVAIVARAAQVGQGVGQTYGINTLGAIIGTVAAGFLLIPTIGVQASLKLGIGVNLLVAAALFAVARSPVPAWRWGRAGAALAAAAALLLVPAWDQRVLSSGPAVYGKEYLQLAERRSLPETLRLQTLLFYKEGPSGTVSVAQEGRHTFLRTNGKLDAGTAVDMPTQLMSGHLPLLFHPNPKLVLVIGMGSGITAGAVSRHPIERLDIAEIEPAILEASRFFAQIHGRVLEDPRVRPIVADGRNFLLTSPDRYDVIISEPSNPWVGGLASLFSAEFFQLAREHLGPDGIMLQWLQGYNLSPDDLRMVLNTFRTAFPSTSVWNTIRGDYLLVGRRDPAPLDLERVKRRYQSNPGVWRDLDRVGLQSWAGVLGFFMLGEGDAARLTEGAGINDDDRLPLEFSAPRYLYVNTTEQNWQMVRSFRTADLPAVTAESQGELRQPDVRYSIGASYLNRGVWVEAYEQFQAALRLNSGHVPAMLGTGAAAFQLGRPAETWEVAKRVLLQNPDQAFALYWAGMAADALNDRGQAVALLRRAVTLQPQNADIQAAWRRVAAKAAGRPS